MAGKAQSKLTDHFTIKKTAKCSSELISKKVLTTIKDDEAAYSSLSTTTKRKRETNGLQTANICKKQKVIASSREIIGRNKINPALNSKIKQKSAELGEQTKKVDSAINIERTVNESSKPYASNQQIDEKVKSSAYEKNLCLIKQPGLTLPYAYKVLETMFSSVDQVVSMMHNRREKCSFSKLKQAVQQMTRKNFELDHLAQIAQVYPKAYSFEQEQGKTFSYRDNLKPGEFQLVVTANVYDIASVSGSGNGSSQEQKTFKSMTPSVLIERRNSFHNFLLEMVKDHHEVFLSSLQPPMSVDRNKLTRWHSRFLLDKVPDIAPAALPQSPNKRIYVTAKDVLEKACGVYGKRIETALEAVAAKFESSNADNKLLAKPPTNPALKGIPQSLIDKIRAKEKAKLCLELTKAPEQMKKDSMMSKLPEIARILRTYFVTEKKNVVKMEDAILVISDSLPRPILPNLIEEHIRLLIQLAPEWLKMVTVKKGIYLRMDKEKDVNCIIENFNNR